LFGFHDLGALCPAHLSAMIGQIFRPVFLAEQLFI
jgi:hypothetical protein